MIKIGLLGAHGRMGKLISHLATTEFKNNVVIAAQVNRKEPYDSLFETDVVIDVSHPDAMTELAQAAIERTQKLPVFVVGSTGWSSNQKHVLDTLSKKTAVLISTNFSTGVFAVSEILKEYSPLLAKLGYTPVLVETHHRHKKDAPSGTALSLQSAMASAKFSQIQTHSIRAGEVVGDHEITFYGQGDRISFGHFAQDRSIFARGAIEVARWLATQQASTQPLKGILGIDRYFESLQNLGASL